jgi:nucleoside-diphosphate-sugar epimerase
MRVLVTGAGGFIGKQLLQALLEEPALRREEGQSERIGEIVATSRTGTLSQAIDDPRVSVKTGDIANPAFVERLFEKRIDSVFHLAGTPIAESEKEFELGMKVNVLGFIRLLEECRRQGTRPRVIHASSIAAFGGRHQDRAADRGPHMPQSSGGTAKAIGELLVNDYSRRGFVDGRALRLPIVLARPEPARFSVSDHIGALIREPLMGRDVVCPLDPERCVPVASVRNAARSLIRMHEIPTDRFGDTRAMNMPALTISLGELADLAESADHPGPKGRVFWELDREIQATVDGWPSIVLAEEAQRHGLAPNANAAEIVRHFIEDYQPRGQQPRPQLTLVESVREEAAGDF